jgi:hypothetical protein
MLLKDKLSLFFTDRQLEIIYKKYDGEILTKTEKEYYSRSIKKKLQALADENIADFSKQILYY